MVLGEGAEFRPGPFWASPLQSVRDLLRWTPDVIAKNPGLRGTVPFRGRGKTLSAQKRRVIHCHDMMGNYLVEDSPLQGAHQDTIYKFKHWHLIDIFIYFSHNRVTIPPPSYINAAHRHGVLVLGTFITEWGPGIRENLTFLFGPGNEDEDPTTTEPCYEMGDRLVAMAVEYGFDGWFFNLESPLPSSAHAEAFAKLVKYTTEKMHAAIPHSQVIWYDSVVRTGNLAWQDRLNNENKMFFDSCDGIFTNYTWRENAPFESVALARDRSADVYTGIDVFGRNTFGGGGFSTYKALEVIEAAGTSAAIFAPGWTYECHRKTNHDAADARFWEGDIGKEREAVLGYVDPRGVPNTLPLVSTFCQGHGKKFWVAGRCVSRRQWNDLGHQSLQPNMLLPGALQTGIEARIDYTSSFDGGASLRIRCYPPIATSGNPMVVPLFRFDGGGIYVGDGGLNAECTSRGGAAGMHKTLPCLVFRSPGGGDDWYPIEPASVSDEGHAWTTTTGVIPAEAGAVNAIGVAFPQGTAEWHIGRVVVTHRTGVARPPAPPAPAKVSHSSIRWSWTDASMPLRPSLCLSWSASVNAAQYDIFADGAFIGRTPANKFEIVRLSTLISPFEDISGLNIEIIPIGEDGRRGSPARYWAALTNMQQ